MRVFPDLPDLTPAEAARCWLKPRQVLDTAKLDDRDPNARKLFDNLTNRGGFIPSEPGGTGRTSPRLFSLVSCVMARAMVEEMGRTRPAGVAAVVARACADLLPDALAFPTLQAFRDAERGGLPWRVLLVDIALGTVRTTVVDGPDFTVANLMARDWWACSSVFPHHLLLRCIETYAEVWGEARDKEAKGRKRAAPLAIGAPPVKACA